MIRWIANLIFVVVAVALAIFFLRIQTVNGSISIRVRDASERGTLWRSITGDAQAPVAEPQSDTQPDVPAKSDPQPDSPTPKKSAPINPPGKKPAEKDLDREGLDSLIEKSL